MKGWNMPAAASAAFTKKLTKFASVHSNGTAACCSYTFGPAGRIATVELTDRSYFFNFTAADALVVREVNNSTQQLMATIHCTLNHQGFISSMLFKNRTGDVKKTIIYIYDAKGCLVKRQHLYRTGVIQEDVYEFENGSLTCSMHFSDEILINTTLYAYGSKKPDKTPFGWGAYWFVKNLFGIQPRFLPEQVKTVQPNGQVTQHSQLTYEFDKAGYPLKRTVHDLLNGTAIVNTFEFT
jgi:hypothetical protein